MDVGLGRLGASGESWAASPLFSYENNGVIASAHYVLALVDVRAGALGVR